MKTIAALAKRSDVYDGLRLRNRQLASGKIFTATVLIGSKPHLDVFLYGVEMMRFSPQKFVVIEDIPAGVMAGVNAGMTVFGYAMSVRLNLNLL
ncbi:HAD family phosphatase [Calothrix sp. FACHB-156]|nr:HAD family phosphatase [Nostoc linckia FACHB-104]MBD2339963.1 HAD family phosphatase [Calothrix sp. FACHB-156]